GKAWQGRQAERYLGRPARAPALSYRLAGDCSAPLILVEEVRTRFNPTVWSDCADHRRLPDRSFGRRRGMGILSSIKSGSRFQRAIDCLTADRPSGFIAISLCT